MPLQPTLEGGAIMAPFCTRGNYPVPHSSADGGTCRPYPAFPWNLLLGQCYPLLGGWTAALVRWYGGIRSHGHFVTPAALHGTPTLRLSSRGAAAGGWALVIFTSLAQWPSRGDSPPSHQQSPTPAGLSLSNTAHSSNLGWEWLVV